MAFSSDASFSCVDVVGGPRQHTGVTGRMHHAAKRDALTGIPIRPDLPVVPWEIPAHLTNRPRYLEASHNPLTGEAYTPDLIEAPIRLHTRRPTRVGQTYTHLIDAYLAAGEWEDRFKQTEAERLEDKCWWQSEYGIQLVRKRLLEYHQLPTVIRILEAITTMHEERLDVEQVMERYNRSSYWVISMFNKCNGYANFHRRACQCEDCQERRAKRAS